MQIWVTIQNLQVAFERLQETIIIIENANININIYVDHSLHNSFHDRLVHQCKV
jgi:hypothetical protein